MYENIFDGFGKMLVVSGIGLFFLGAILFRAIDFFFVEDAIITTKPIRPEIRLVINDNQVDTLYVYRQLND